MKVLLSIAILMLIVSCSARHDEVYSYEAKAYTTKSTSKAYTTDRVSAFEFRHYKYFGNTNILILEDLESLKDQERKKDLEELCTDLEMNCKTFDLSKLDEVSAQKAIDYFNSFESENFFVVSPNKALTGKFVATVNLLDHEGSEDTVKEIFTTIGIEEPEALIEQVLKLKQ